MRVNLLIVLTVFLLYGNVTAQKAVNKDATVETKAKSAKKMTKIDVLMSLKEFEFSAYTVLPMNSGPRNVVGDNYAVRFSPTKIESVLPYFGSKRGSAYGRDKGMRFSGKPIDYTIKQSDGMYTVTAKVRARGGAYDISMEVFDTGSATLTIMSENRDTMRYRGEVR